MKKRQNIRKALIIISFLLFPITIFYLSPYLIVFGATTGVIVGSMIVFMWGAKLKDKKAQKKR